MTAIGNHLWQSTLFAILATLIVALLRSYQAKVRFWIWFAASVKFLLPFALLIAIGAQAARSPAKDREPDSVPSVSIRAAQPFGIELPSRAAVQPERMARDPKAKVLVAIWFGGFVLIALRRYRDWKALRRSLQASIESPIASEIPVRFAFALIEPSVAGWWRPVLLLPAGITDSLTAAQLDALLTHELAHARRKDNLLAAVHMLVEALFWFHPLVWWIGAQLIKERERACDEEVLRRGAEPRVYAEGIAAVCRTYARSPWSVAAGVSGWSIKHRVEEIMNNCRSRELTRVRTAALIAAGACVLAMPIATGVLNAPALLAQTQPLRFKSVTIKTCSPGPNERKGAGFTSEGGVLRTGCMPLADEQSLGLIQRAYVRFGANGGVNWPSIVPVKGQPAWFTNDLFEITGVADPGTTEETLQGPMLRSVLEDRFKLKIREESVGVLVYELTSLSSIPSLGAFAEGSCTPMPSTFPPPKLAQGQRYCIVRVGMQPPAIDAEGATADDLAHLLSRVLDKPVVNKTSLQGRFNMHVKFAPDSSTPSFLPGGEAARFATPPAPDTRNLATTLEQLGLRLTSENGAQRQIVIDRVEKPALD